MTSASPLHWRRLTRVAVATAISGAALVIELILLQAVLPALHLANGAASVDVVLNGVATGLAASLIAAGLVLTYRSLRIINFAQAAIGVAGALFTFDLLQLTPVPFAVAMPAGLLVAGATGLLFQLAVGTRFAKAPRIALTVFTIAAAAFISTVGTSAVDALPFFPVTAQRTIAELNGTQQLAHFLPFSGFQFKLPGQLLPAGFPTIFAITCPIGLLAALAAFLRYTRVGTAMRAMAENSERAALLGIGVTALAGLVWATAGVLSGSAAMLTGFLAAPKEGLAVTQLLIPALAAAVIARMRSIGVAVVASLGIAIATSVLSFTSGATLAPLISGFLLVAIVVGLLSQRRRDVRSDQAATSSWSATEEIRPTPRELARLPVVRLTKWALIGIVVLAAILYPFIVSTDQVFVGQTILLSAIVGLSIVALTGWTGQVSLGQLGIAAIGAVIAGSLASHLGLTFWLDVPIAVAVSAGIAVLVGLPALRLPGLFLAVATFVFAAAVQQVLFDKGIFGWLLPSGGLARPTMPFVDFDDERSMYFLCIVALVVVLVLLANIRRTRLGRILIGVRDNEANAEAEGISVLRSKLTGFALAGAIAGFAGALMAFQAREVTSLPFAPEASSGLFITTVIGGVSSLAGPLLGSSVIAGVNQATASVPLVQAAIAPSLAVLLLYLAPGGLVSVAAKARDAVLRIIAQRNNIIAPSLFADMDPAALHLRLIPLATQFMTGGRVSLRRRYELTDSRRIDRRHTEEWRTGDIVTLAAAGADAPDAVTR